MSKSIFTIRREQLQVVQERVFDAPRELVFKIVTDPQMVQKWWAPRVCFPWQVPRNSAAGQKVMSIVAS